MLKVDGGGVVQGTELKSYISNHYRDLFTTHTGGHTEEVTRCVTVRVTQHMNEVLTAPYSGDEIWKALECMGDLKAPGADGIPALF